MRSDLLPDYIDAALEDNEALVPELATATSTLETVLEVCRNYRVAAVGSLLVTGLSSEFLRRLHQSGTAFADFLARASADMKLTSKSTPFLDAVAADDSATARTIAEGSRMEWVEGEEYEEDFLFFEYLMRRFYVGATQKECESILARYEKSLADTEDLRLDICRCLMVKDADAFDSTLERYLRHRSDRLDALAAKRSIPSDELATLWHVSVEGVALVRLAHVEGIATRSNFLHIPSTALERNKEAWTPDDWRFVGRSPG
jgi:hypothetical protein